MHPNLMKDLLQQMKVNKLVISHVVDLTEKLPSLENGQSNLSLTSLMGKRLKGYLFDNINWYQISQHIQIPSLS